MTDYALPSIKFQKVGDDTYAARFGAGWLIQTATGALEGAGVAVSEALVYVPDSLSRINEPEECIAGTCGYLEYLGMDPASPGMPHLEFHRVEARAQQHAKTCQREAFCPTCERFEMRLRA